MSEHTTNGTNGHAHKTHYQAGVVDYSAEERHYYDPAYTPKDTEVLAAFRVTPQEGVPWEEEAADILSQEGKQARVVSMPSTEIFDTQSIAYRAFILPENVRARVAVEAGATLGWHKYVGDYGRVVGLDRFGASAPYEVLYEKFGLTPDAIAAAARYSMALAPKS